METFSTLPVPVNSPHKGRWHEALMFPLICVWINGWENNHKAGDLKRYRAHYDVINICADIGTRSGFKVSIYSHWHWNNCMITRANVTPTGLGKMDHYITTKKTPKKHSKAWALCKIEGMQCSFVILREYIFLKKTFLKYIYACFILWYATISSAPFLFT